MKTPSIITFFTAWVILLSGCVHPHRATRLHDPDSEFIRQAAMRHLQATFPEWARTNYTIRVLVNAFPTDKTTEVSYGFDVERPRTWRSFGRPFDSVIVEMDMNGNLRRAYRSGYSDHVRNSKAEEEIRDRFIKSGATNYNHWSVDVDDSEQYAVRLYSYPLRDFSSLAGLPIRRLDVIVSWGPLDLTALNQMPLQYLQLHKTGSFDLFPLAGTSLRGIELCTFQPVDVAPLTNCPIEVFQGSACVLTNQLQMLRKMSTIREIDRKPTEQFWQEYDEIKKAEQAGRAIR